jgi:hypothetical protein
MTACSSYGNMILTGAAPRNAEVVSVPAASHI